MNVSLTPELDQIVITQIASGRYLSPDDVVRDDLLLMEEQALSKSARLAEFNEELARRLEELDRGEYADPAQVRERIRQRSELRRSQSK